MKLGLHFKKKKSIYISYNHNNQIHFIKSCLPVNWINYNSVELYRHLLLSYKYSKKQNINNKFKYKDKMRIILKDMSLL